MATLHYSANTQGDSKLDLNCAGNATGADMTMRGVDGSLAAVFVGGPSLLEIASKCAAIVAGVNDGEQQVTILSGAGGYGVTPEGRLSLLPTSYGSVVVVLTPEAGGGSAGVELDRGQVATFGNACAAAGHDL